MRYIVNKETSKAKHMLDLLTRPRALLFLCNMLLFFFSWAIRTMTKQREMPKWISFIQFANTKKKILLNLRFCVFFIFCAYACCHNVICLSILNFCSFWLCLPLPGSGMAWLCPLCSPVCAYVVITYGCSSMRITK